MISGYRRLGVEIVKDFSGLQQQGTATVGEAFTRVISIRASGLTAEQLPAPTLEVNGFKTYSDKPVFTNNNNDKGVYGIRTERVTMIPAKTSPCPPSRFPGTTLQLANGRMHNWQRALLSCCPPGTMLPPQQQAAIHQTTNF